MSTADGETRRPFSFPSVSPTIHIWNRRHAGVHTNAQGSRPKPAPLFAPKSEAYFFFAAFFAGFFAFFAFFLAAIVLTPFKEGLSLAIPR